MSEQIGGVEHDTWAETWNEKRKKRPNYSGPLGRKQMPSFCDRQELGFSNGQVDSNMTQGQCYQGNKAKGVMLSRVSALKMAFIVIAMKVPERYYG